MRQARAATREAAWAVGAGPDLDQELRQVARDPLSLLLVLGGDLLTTPDLHALRRRGIELHGPEPDCPNQCHSACALGFATVLDQPLAMLGELGLMAKARLVLTDSGGLQEETTVLGVPCITLRDTTERPVTVDQGTNTVVGHDSKQIMAIVSDVLSNGGKRGRTPELWDGRAAIRIKSVLTDWLQQRTAPLSKAKFQ